MELNAEQIKKALECCSGIAKCVDCPYAEIEDCAKQNARDVIALIKELAEEIKDLTETAEVRAKVVERLQILTNEIEEDNRKLTEEKKRLRKENDLLHSTRKNHFNRAQRNVILAIQERFTMRFGTYTDGDMTPIKEVFSLLDKFEKEMLEDAE